jgi:hypothetical protein
LSITSFSSDASQQQTKRTAAPPTNSITACTPLALIESCDPIS